MADPAQCTLASFLDAPATAPPADWRQAASHSNSEAELDSEDLVERARLARERAEGFERRVADLGAVRGLEPAVDQATAVLVAAFNVRTERAFECLVWVSEQAGIGLTEAAERFTDRVEALGDRGHDRDELLGLLGRLAERPLRPEKG